MAIMRSHSSDMLAMSVQDEHEDFFRAVADLIPLASDSESITVVEYLKTAPARTDGSRVVSYITESGSANQYFLLASARSIRVFNCSEPYTERFLRRYAETWPDKVCLSRPSQPDDHEIWQITEELGNLLRCAHLAAAVIRRDRLTTVTSA